MLNAMLIQLGTNDTQLAGGISAAGSQIHLTGHKIKVDPRAILTRQNAFGAQHHTIGAQIQFLQSVPNKVHSELLVGLCTPRGKDLVSMVMVVIMIMTTAGTVLIMFMMVVMVMIVIVMMVLMLMIVMMVVMVMATAITMFIVIMVVMLRRLHLRNDLGNGGAAFHGLLQLLTGQFTPGSGNHGRIGIALL